MVSRKFVVALVLLVLMIPAAFVFGVVSGRSMAFDGHEYRIRRGERGPEMEISSRTHLGEERRIIYFGQYNMAVHIYLNDELMGFSQITLPFTYDGTRLMHIFALTEQNVFAATIGDPGRQVVSGCHSWWAQYWDEDGLVYAYRFEIQTDGGVTQVTEYHRSANAADD